MTEVQQTHDPVADLQAVRVSMEEVRIVIARATQRITDLGAERDELLGFVNGLLGLVQLITSRDDLPREIREAMLSNHRYVDALAYVEDCDGT